MADDWSFLEETRPRPMPSEEEEREAIQSEPAPRAHGFAWKGVRHLERPLPPVEYAVPGLRLAPGAVSIVAGFGYSGKTMAMQAVMVALALGRPIWGLWTAKPMAVGHLDYEQGDWLCTDRVQKLAKGCGGDLGTLGDDRYRLVSLPDTYVTNPKIYEHMCTAFDGCGLILVDSFRASCPGVDENDSKARVPLDVLTRVGVRLHAAVVVIHHARKDQQNGPSDERQILRGSSAIFDAAQSIYTMHAEKGQPARVKHVKDRLGGKPLEDFGLAFEDTADGGIAVRHLDAAQLEANDSGLLAYEALCERILEAVRQGASSKSDVFRMRVHGNRNKLFKVIGELVEDGRLKLVSGRLVVA